MEVRFLIKLVTYNKSLLLKLITSINLLEPLSNFVSAQCHFLIFVFVRNTDCHMQLLILMFPEPWKLDYPTF